MGIKATVKLISFALLCATTILFAQPSHTNLLYSHMLDNTSAPLFFDFDNNGGSFLAGQGWKATTNTSQLAIALPRGLPQEGTFVLDVTDFDPAAQNMRNKQQIINMYSQSSGNKDIFDSDGSWFNIRTGTDYSAGAGVAGFRFLASPRGGTNRTDADCLQDRSWNVNATYEFKIIWSTEKIYLYLDGILIVDLDFSGQIELFRYIFIGTDNVYNAQVGPVYSNLRIYGPDYSSSVSFSDITAGSGTRGYSDVGYHHGVSFADVNADGQRDLFVSNAAGIQSDPDLLYINRGNSIFQNEAGSRGTSDVGSTHGIVSADFDNDGDLDALFVNMPVGSEEQLAKNKLYRNDGSGDFTGISNWAGLTSTRNSRSALALDVDSDGFLDIYVNNWGEQNETYLNDGGGKFSKVDAGAEGPTGDSSAKQGVTAGDVDGDGDIDIYVSRREAVNWLFINDGSGNFTEQADERGVARGARSHGSTFADYDNDGDLDLFVANFAYSTGPLPLLGVYKNDGNGYFEDLSDQYAISVSAYTVVFGDVDNDADPDMYLIRNDEKNRGTRPKLYLNDGAGNLTAEPVPGLEVAAADARSAAYADIDNDGDIDFYVVCSDGYNFMLQNNSYNANNYVQVLCNGPEGDYGGFGTKVYVFEPGHLGEMDHLLGFQESVSNFGYLGQNQTALHFGLGQFTACDLRLVRTDGGTSEHQHVPANQLFEMSFGPLRVVTASLPDGIVYTPYVFDIQVRGGVFPYSYSISSGALPDGLFLDSATGRVSGTSDLDGDFLFTLEVRDNDSPNAVVRETLTLHIDPLPDLEILSTTLPAGMIDEPYLYSLAVSGGLAPYSFSISNGSLPQGLTIDPVTGTINGVPSRLENTQVTIEVTDSQIPARNESALLGIQIIVKPPIDEEFITTSLHGYTRDIPLVGPEISSGERIGWLRFDVPAQGLYDHWSNVDTAPQLRKLIEPGNWEIDTRCELTEVGGTLFHIGLLVYFSQYDLFYWGFNGDANTVKLSRSGAGGLIDKSYNGGNTVDLRIRKTGQTYQFYYKSPSATDWINAGSRTATESPVEVGLIVKTWEQFEVLADFDFLRVDTDSEVPVELAAFSAFCADGRVELKWKTLSETDNWGFAIERNCGDTWVKRGFVPGAGFSSSPLNYSFTDSLGPVAGASYRLVQMDLTGSCSISPVIHIKPTLPSRLALSRNYPNPFNPKTSFDLEMPETRYTTVLVYNTMGQLLRTLARRDLSAGVHRLQWDGTDDRGNPVQSGVYYINVKNELGSITRKTLLVR